MLRAVCSAAALALLIAGLAGAARADYAVLRSGQRLHITGYESQGATIILYVEGGRVQVAAEELVRIEPEDRFDGPVATAPPGPFAKLIRAAALRHGVDETLITSIIAAESNFDPHAISRKQAQGLMQLMPGTVTRLAVRNVWDPSENIEAGTRYLRELLDRYHNNLMLALAAYNAGPDRVDAFGGVPPFPETRAYLRRVTAELKTRQKTAPAGLSLTSVQ